MMSTTYTEFVAYLLPLALLIILLTRLTASRVIDLRLIADFLYRRHPLATIFIILLVIFLLFDLPFLLSRHMDVASPISTFWLQTAAGNWSPDGYQTLSGEYFFALSAFAAIWLNNGLLLAILAVGWRLLRERSTAMKLKTAFATRDQVIETFVIARIMSLIPNANLQMVKKEVRTSIDLAKEHWKYDTLNSMYERDADTLRKRMEEIQIL